MELEQTQVAEPTPTISKKKGKKLTGLARFFRYCFVILLLSISGVLAGWYGIKQKSPVRWNAEAILSAPAIQALGNYYPLATTYAFLQGKSLESEALSKQVYQAFRQHLASGELKKAFLQQNDKVKQYAADQKQLVEAVIPTFLDGFEAGKTYANVHFVWHDADVAKALLNDYLQFVAVKTREQLNETLVTEWKVLFQQVKFSAETQMGAVLQGNQVAQQDWQSKLNLMKAVQPLDNSLIPYRLQTLSVTPYHDEERQYFWACWGGVIGLLLALFFIGFTRLGRKA